MRWEDERWVKVYTRDTTDWLALSFDAQALFLMLLRKVDRAGLLPLGKLGKRGVAVIVGHASAWERLAPAVEELLSDGCVVIADGVLRVPNFLAAQEARASDKARQAKAREMPRDPVRSTLKPGTVYVVRVDGRVKVGFTTGPVEERLRNYRTHTPSVELLGHFAGTQADEQEAHASLGVTTRAGEWCIPTPEALDLLLSRGVTESHTASHGVTRGHAESHGVTPRVDKSRQEQSREDLFPEAAVASPVPAKKAKEAKKGPTDPRHAPLVKALVETCGYPFRNGRDAKAVSELLALSDQQEATRGEAAGLEVIRRARIGWAWTGHESKLARSITDIVTNWGHYATEHQPRSQGPPDFRRGSVRAEMIDHTKPEDPF